MRAFFSYQNLFYSPLSLKAISAWAGKPIILNIDKENRGTLDKGTDSLISHRTNMMAGEDILTP